MTAYRAPGYQATTAYRRPRTRSKTEKVIARLVEVAAIYALDAWTLMLVFGGLHSWRTGIPAIPFWPMLGLLYVAGTSVGFVLWCLVRGARSWRDEQ